MSAIPPEVAHDHYLTLAQKQQQIEHHANKLLQIDLADLCRALGLPDAPQPKSPHEVFRECVGKVAQLQFDLKAARHEIECADEQINRRKALFQKIAEIAEELERAARERWLFRDIENREPIINLRRISEIARAASSNASNQLKVSP